MQLTEAQKRAAQPLLYRVLRTATITVGLTAVEAVPENARREYLLLVNDSDAAIYLNFVKDAVLSEGVRLNPAGGSYEISKAFGNLTGVKITAISSAAAKKLLVVEG